MGEISGWMVLCFIFGVFGLYAFFELDGIKRRLREMEQSLAQVGTGEFVRTQRAERQALVELAQRLAGQAVTISFKDEDATDSEVLLSTVGNSNGTCSIVDVDADWLLVRLESRKACKDKLLRLDTIASINAKE